MSEIPTAPPSGFRDFLPEACLARARVIDAISRVYRSYGFSQISTSAVEDLAVLTGKGGGENEKLIFKILKRGDKLASAQGSSELADLGLRFDLTLPLARYYSRHRGVLPSPFKAFAIGPVWRAERAQKGRYREFYQCDADILGSESSCCEIEVISAVLSVFKDLALPAPAVLLNDRRLLFALCDRWRVPPDKRGDFCIALDKLDKTGPDAVLRELGGLLGGAASEELRTFVQSGTADPALLSAAAPGHMANLLAIRDGLAKLFPDYGSFAVSPALARGLDYYTGTIYELRLATSAGSLGGGGRYDGLTEKFGGPRTPACGISIGFERLMLLMEGNVKVPGPDACMTVFSEDLRPACLRLAAQLRGRGLSVDVYPGAAKLKTQFKYADSRKARFALVLGPEEAAQEKIKAKELATGQEYLLKLDELVERLA
ncbi:MAG: histidine--tRNA ligase [Elusimicrobia bacterium]|nr:histidine--tRNA ligase [Elusimicrobiota bacterium]